MTTESYSRQARPIFRLVLIPANWTYVSGRASLIDCNAPPIGCNVKYLTRVFGQYEKETERERTTTLTNIFHLS